MKSFNKDSIFSTYFIVLHLIFIFCIILVSNWTGSKLMFNLFFCSYSILVVGLLYGLIYSAKREKRNDGFELVAIAYGYTFLSPPLILLMNIYEYQ